MKYILKVDNISEVESISTRPLIAADENDNLFAEDESKDPVIEFVDLGLPSGLLWANYNYGVNPNQLSKADDWYGNYYAWGEIETKTYYDWVDPNDATQNYKYANGASNKLTKYCNNRDYGNNRYKDDLTTLEPTDDVTTVTNSAWRMPTKAECVELLENTTHVWVTNYNNISDLNGEVFTGTNGNSIFIPAAGSWGKSGYQNDGSWGEIWSSSLNEGSRYNFTAWELYFRSDFAGAPYSDRYQGLPVRAVCTVN